MAELKGKITTVLIDQTLTIDQKIDCILAVMLKWGDERCGGFEHRARNHFRPAKRRECHFCWQDLRQ